MLESQTHLVGRSPVGNRAGLGSDLVLGGVCGVAGVGEMGMSLLCPFSWSWEGPRAPLRLPNVLSQEWEILP